MIRYDPRDLSHVYVKDPYGRNHITIPYRNLANPTISLLEHRSVLKQLKRLKTSVDEKTMFAAALQQRDLLQKARKDTASARRQRQKVRTRTKLPTVPSSSVPMPEEPELSGGVESCTIQGGGLGLTTNFDHLAPECREDAVLPSPERIRRIQAEHWISYPPSGSDSRTARGTASLSSAR